MVNKYGYSYTGKKNIRAPRPNTMNTNNDNRENCAQRPCQGNEAWRVLRTGPSVPKDVFVLCCDLDMNNSIPHTRGRVYTVCKSDFDVMQLPRKLDAYPRYVCDLLPFNHNGRWVNVLIEHELIIRFFTSGITELKNQLRNHCTVCHFPRHQCLCNSMELLAPMSYEVTLGENVINNDRDLNVATISKKHLLYACVDYTEVQAKKSYNEILTVQSEWDPVVKILEDCATLFYQLKISRNMIQVVIAWSSFVRSLTGKSFTGVTKDWLERQIAVFKECFSVQSDKHWTETVSDVYENYARAKDTILAQRLKRVFNHVVAHCIYTKMGLEFNSELFDKIEAQKIRPNLGNCLNFADAVAGLLTFLLKQGRQAMILGSIEPLYLSSDTTAEWFTKTRDLIVKSKYLGNPKAVGIDLFKYLYEVDCAYDSGRSILKFMKDDTLQRRTILNTNMELSKIKNDFLTVSAATGIRKQPLGVVLFGTPGIGKSSVLEMLYHYDCTIRGRDPNPIYRYQVPSDSDHFDNFKSYHHTMVLDDVAQHNPGKIPGIDPSNSMLIRILNNQGFCPPQAALEDKGKTPVLCDLVFVTTNVVDLNIPIYYTASYAPMRRLPIHIEPVVKKEFRKEGTHSIDPTKAVGTGNYDDFWEYIIREPCEMGSQKGIFKKTFHFKNVRELLAWFKIKSDTHAQQQSLMVERCRSYKELETCSGCNEPRMLCNCSEPQGSKVVHEDGSVTYTFTPPPSPPIGPMHRKSIPPVGQRVYEPWSYADEREPVFMTTNENTGHTFTSNSTKWFPSKKSKPDSFTEATWDQEKREYVFHPKTEKPWRSSDVPLGVRTMFNPCFRKSFVNTYYSESMSEFDKDSVHRYATFELPYMFTEGYTMNQISEDFFRYVKYRMEEARLQELDDCLSACYNMADNKNPNFVDFMFRFCMYLYLNNVFFRTTIHKVGSFTLIRRRFLPIVRNLLGRSDNQLYVMRQVGQKIDDKIGVMTPWAQMMLSVIALIPVGAFIAVMSKVWRSNTEPAYVPVYVAESNESPEEIPEDSCDEEATGDEEAPSDDTALQFGIYPKALNESKKKNPWVSKEKNVTKLDFTTGRITEFDVFKKRCTQNVVKFHCSGNDGKPYSIEGHFLALNSEVFVTCNHLLDPVGELSIHMIFAGKEGVTDSIRFTLQQSQIKRFPERDLCYIKTKAVPCRFKTLHRNFASSTVSFSVPGYILKKHRDGTPQYLNVAGIHDVFCNFSTDNIVIAGKSFRGKPAEPTEIGDCGAPWVALTGYGPIIVGIHSLYHYGSAEASCMRITMDDVEEWCTSDMTEVGEIEVVEEIVHTSKSYLDFYEEGAITYHGELAGFRSRPKHSVRETELANQLYGQQICGYTIEKRLFPPVMDSWRAQQVGLQHFLKPVCVMNEVFLEECCEVYMQHIVTNLPAEELELLHVYPYEVAINGAPGINFVDGIKRSTSMGYPWRTTKRSYLEPFVSSEYPDGVKFVDDIDKKIFDRLDKMKLGIRQHYVFSSNLKDEPVSLKKFLACKTRVFFSCPADFLIIVRMCFMSFCRVAQRNPFVFGVAIGLNPHSSDWNDIYEHLNVFKNAVAGDHEFYDKKMQLLLLKMAMFMIVNIIEAGGQVSREELVVYRVIIHDMVNPTVDYFGMLVTFLGGEVSGHQMTTVLNCIISVLYIMYCYKVVFQSVSDFFEAVRIIALGDDHVFTVRDDRKELNHTKVQTILKDLGLGYTMAEKGAESVPFIPLADCTFLKRKFVWSDELRQVVGPLDVNSIFKMLTIGVKSKTVSSSEQLAQALCSAFAEAFFHGREFFDALNALVANCEKSSDLQYEMRKYEILTYDQYRERFFLNSSSYVAIEDGQSQNPRFGSSDCFMELTVPQSVKRMGCRFCFHARAIPEIRIYGRMELDSKRCRRAQLNECSVGYVSNKALASSQHNLTGNYAENAVPETADQSTDQVQETTLFVNEPETTVLDISSPFDKVYQSQLNPSTLDDFLKRPSIIYQYRWTENGAPGYKDGFNPWALYFSTPAIKNKLQGYSLIRANLTLKFMINGSPFYYGRIGAFYRPLAGFMNNTVPTTTPAAIQQIGVSQRPHVWLDNQTTSNTEMILPFLWPYPFISTGSFADFTKLGSIELWQYAALRSANGVTTTGIDITVYAYCSDYELSGSTARSVLQGKKTYSGAVSGPASTVSAVASKLKNVPVLGAYAMATEKAADIIGDVASFLGFTNTPVIDDVTPMKNVPFQLASSEISEPVMKLSLQPKQETCIGSSYSGGSDEDDLQILKLLQRESFLCGTLWSTTNNVNDLLFYSAVCPSLWDRDSTTSAIGHTPLSYFTSMFEFWRGEIIFRFKVVRSQYHRGRININWDAGNFAANTLPNIGDPSTMNVVIDLDESDEVEVKLPYMQAQPFLRLITTNTNFMNYRNWENSSSVVAFQSSLEFNGTISVRVMNRLTAPEASSDVDILVFVRAGDSFHVAGPSEILPNWTHSATENTVLQSQKVYTLIQDQKDDDLFKQMFGENIVSFRELLHRSSLSVRLGNQFTNLNIGTMHVNIPLKRYPRPPGFYNNGWESAEKSTAGTYAPYNFTRMHPINWILPCFIGYKGSVNITVNLVNGDTGQMMDELSIERLSIGRTLSAAERRPQYFTNVYGASASTSALNKNFQVQRNWGHDGFNGNALTNQKTNTGLVANLPYYVNSLFLITDPYVQYSNEDPISNADCDWYKYSFTYNNKNASANAMREIHSCIYYATGPDFDVVFYLNCPTVFYKNRAGNPA